MKRSALFSFVVLLVLVLTLLPLQTVAREAETTAPPEILNEPLPATPSGRIAPAPRAPRPAGTISQIPQVAVRQQAGWEYGPPSDFEYQRFDGVFVPGPEPWGNKVYFMGGRISAPAELPNIWLFDPLTGEYADTAVDVIEDVSNYNADLIMDDGTGRGPAVYVVGGYDKDGGGGGGSLGLVQRFYPMTGEIEGLPPADDWPGQVGGGTVAGMGTAVVGDVIYVYGGWNSSVSPYFYAGTWVFDPKQPSGSRWTDLGVTLNPGRSYIQSAVQDGKIYAMGGVSGYVGGDLVPTAVVEVLDTNDLAAGWQPVASLPIATGEGRGFGFDSDTLEKAVPSGRLYLAGGADWPDISTEAMEYMVLTDTWDLSFPDLNEPRVNHAGTFIPLETLNPNDGLPGMWVFGGRSHNGCDPPYGPTEFYSFPIEPAGCSVLLVDDDWDQYSGEPFNGSGAYYYTSTLDAIGVNYDRWDVWTQGDPSLADLLPYDTVIWFTGYAWDGTITSTNEADLAAYLDNGGNLFLSSYDYLYDQGLTAFGSGYLGIGEYAEDTGDIDPVGNDGNVVGNGLGPYTLTAPTSWPTGSTSIDYADRVYPGPWAEAPFRYFSNNHANSTNYDSGLYRVAFLGWPLEGLADLDDRVDVLSSVLQWFCYTERPAEVLLVPPGQTGYGVRGTDVAYTLTLINNTPVTDTFDLAYDAAWPVVGPAAVGPVGSGAGTDFVVTVTVYAYSNCYDEDIASVLATSSISPTIYTDSAFLRTISLPPGEGALEGVVYDANTGLGIPDAQVYLSVGDEYMATTWTAADGSYSLGLDACTYEGGADAIGYEGVLYTVTVDLAVTATLDLTLDASWPELAPDAVSMTVPEGGSDVLTLTLSNSGTYDLYFHFEELPADLLYPQGTGAAPAGVDPQIMQEIAAAPDGQTLFVVYMAEQADLSAAYGLSDWSERGWYVYDTLRATAERSQAGVRAYLDAQGIAYQPILSANALAVTADANTVQSLAAMPGVAYLRANQRHYTQPDYSVEQLGVFYAPTQVGNPTWGMSLTQAARVWSELGITGTGVVVANIDTGVHWTHEALQPAYRGWDGASATHDYNWWDPSNICELEGFPVGEPCDNDSHGSATMGLMVGWNRQPDAGDPAWDAFGMAPGAQWMACKGCEYAYCTEVALLSCADFMLAPWDLSGANPDPALRPHVVNNSWGGGPAEWWYNQAVSAWRAAGIFPAFSAGNSGPACGTVESPGDYGTSFATCATDINDETASYSSRGPAQVSGILKPNVCAPGPGTCTSYNGDELYGCDFGGTSAASPHSAGLAALLWSAQPELVGDVALTSWVIEHSAMGITSTQGCGGDTPDDVPNNEYGWGRIDAYAAVDMALNQVWDIPWVDAVPAVGQVAPGASADVQLLFDAAGLVEACYTGTLRVEYNDPYLMEQFLPLEMCVQCVPVSAVGLSWTPTTPTAGLPLTLTASAEGSEPIAYAWDLGDGTGASGIVVSHTYASGGDYRVVLTATNCQTATAVAVYTITVQAGCEPVAGLDLSWIPPSPVVSQDVLFTAQVSGTAPITFSWDFGDGATWVSADATAVHAYTMTGSYTVTLTAENGCGQDTVVYGLVVSGWKVYLPVVFKNAGS